MPFFAANLSMMFTEVPFLKRFEAATACGFKAVEFLWPYEYAKDELKKILDENKLKLALFNTEAGDVKKGEWGHAALYGREKDFEKEIDKAIDYATALNCHTIHVMSGVIPLENERELCRRVFISNMRKAADQAARYNVTLTMEALCPQIKKNYLYSSQYETLALAQEIGKANVKTQLDLFHAQMTDGHLTHLIKDFKGKYAHIQIASVPFRHEPDEGEVDYNYIFKLLDDIGYDGYVGCEYSPRTTTLEGLHWFKIFKEQHNRKC